MIKNLWSERKIDFWSESLGGTQMKKSVHKQLAPFLRKLDHFEFPSSDRRSSLTCVGMGFTNEKNVYTNDTQTTHTVFVEIRAFWISLFYRCSSLPCVEGVTHKQKKWVHKLLALFSKNRTILKFPLLIDVPAPLAWEGIVQMKTMCTQMIHKQLTSFLWKSKHFEFPSSIDVPASHGWEGVTHKQKKCVHKQFTYVTCYRSADVTDETKIRLLLLNIKNKDDSLLGWTLPKICIIPKKASNKSFLASNFGQKSPWGHMCISLPEWS